MLSPAATQRLLIPMHHDVSMQELQHGQCRLFSNDVSQGARGLQMDFLVALERLRAGFQRLNLPSNILMHERSTMGPVGARAPAPLLALCEWHTVHVHGLFTVGWREIIKLYVVDKCRWNRALNGRGFKVAAYPHGSRQQKQEVSLQINVLQFSPFNRTIQYPVR